MLLSVIVLNITKVIIVQHFMQCKTQTILFQPLQKQVSPNCHVLDNKIDKVEVLQGPTCEVDVPQQKLT